MQGSENSALLGGGSRDKGQMGAGQAWLSEHCWRPMCLSRMGQGQQKILESEKLWRLNRHVGPSPGQV